MHHYLPPRRRTHAAVTSCLIAVISFSIAGCALFDALKPALIPAARALLEQLDLLLVAYETADLPQNASDTEIADFLSLQNARQSILNDQLTLCAPHLTPNERLAYLDRINGSSATVP